MTNDICPGNICPGDICPYLQYLSCYWPNLDQTFNIGSWEHTQQITTFTTTFVQTTFVLGTFVHICNISVFQFEHFRLQSCHILLSNCSLSPSIKTKSGLYLIPVRTRRTRGTSRSFLPKEKFSSKGIFFTHVLWTTLLLTTNLLDLKWSMLVVYTKAIMSKQTKPFSCLWLSFNFYKVWH